MEFHLSFDPPALPEKISLRDKIMLSGSCFTEHMSAKLKQYKFHIQDNPHGILFNPVSLANSVKDCITNKHYSDSDIFFDQGIWSGWDFHSRFSDPDPAATLAAMNQSVESGHQFMKSAQWLILTFGSAFVYQLESGQIVANCHKAPASLFRKRLLTVEEVLSELDNLIHRVYLFNPDMKIIFTISPVRHLRDGLIENNRSKAVLIQAIHHLVQKFNKIFYFPAYELVIDDLRDYRFFAEDMVHPNYQATNYVWEKFTDCSFSDSTREAMKEIYKLSAALAHRPLHPGSDMHKKFMQKNLAVTMELAGKFPFLDFSKEIAYFSS
jgi:GSCFA family